MIGRGSRAALLLALLSLAHVAAAETGGDAGAEPTWWPAVSLQAGAVFHSFQSKIVSSDLADAPLGNPQPIRPSAAGTSVYPAPWLRADLELVGPAIPFAPTLRPFVHGGLGVEFGVSRDIAKEATIGEFALAPGFPSNTMGAANLEQLVRGQGSKITVETEPLFFSAGVGMSLTTRVAERTLRIKPSFEYFWQQVRAGGSVHRAVLENPDPSDLDDFRLVSLSETEVRSFHAIGPGLELETDVSRKKSMVATVFLSGTAMYFVGERKIELNQTNALGESAFFSIERKPWSWRVGVGVRVRFEQ
jgi:hypothetical protein